MPETAPENAARGGATSAAEGLVQCDSERVEVPVGHVEVLGRLGEVDVRREVPARPSRALLPLGGRPRGNVEVDQTAAQRRYASRQGTKWGSGESWLNGAWETHHAEDRSRPHCSKAVLKVVK